MKLDDCSLLVNAKTRTARYGFIKRKPCMQEKRLIWRIGLELGDARIILRVKEVKIALGAD